MTQQLKTAHSQQVSGALDSAGNFFPLESCQITKVTDSAGALLYTLAEYAGSTWKRSVSKVPEGSGTREILSLWKKLGPPAAPSITSVVAGNGKATIAIQRASDDGGYPVTADRVYAFNAYTDAPLGYVDGLSPISFTGLANGTPVYFRAASINSAGAGASSERSNSVTPINSITALPPLINGAPINAIPL